MICGCRELAGSDLHLDPYYQVSIGTPFRVLHAPARGCMHAYDSLDGIVMRLSVRELESGDHIDRLSARVTPTLRNSNDRTTTRKQFSTPPLQPNTMQQSVKALGTSLPVRTPARVSRPCLARATFSKVRYNQSSSAHTLTRCSTAR